MSPSALRTLSCLTVSASDAERRVGLDVDLPGAAEAVEVVDVVAAQVRLQRVEDVGQRHAHRLDLLAVDVHVELRRAGAEAVEQADQAGLLVALGGQVVRLGLQRVEVDVAGRFHHQLEAAGVAQAVAPPAAPKTSTRASGISRCEPLAELGRDGLAAQRRVAPFVERLEDDEHRAVVRADGVQDERHARDGRACGRRRASPGRSSRPSSVTSSVRSSEAESGSWMFDTR